MDGINSSTLSNSSQDSKEWLEAMKAKHAKNLNEINGNRVKKMKRNIIKKALKALATNDELESENESKNKKNEQSKMQQEEQKKLKELERRRIFSKHVNMQATFPKTIAECEIEKQMEDAIRHNNTTKIDYLNKQLSDIHINQVLQEAEKKTRYELKLKKEKELHKSKYKPILNWKFTKKERWERKGNS